ncbi:hypothetical protein PHPALM_31262 [Phytophthora palmivora]|uniref:Uncharacterized protein n=1 Tax=Phytophthora palmivora TaxID=4796 RepID=A0A2P4X328_9STRA|nr:hypothetical protein PHPALM_31262 [Phytophthora palmivora]
MQILHIPAEKITGMMLRGFVDSLTVIPRDRIDPHGINYVIGKGIQQMLVNRTNNPLERHNRELNGAFLTSHPNILTFVGVIGDHASHYVILLEDIAHNQSRAPPHGVYVIPQDLTI